MYGSIFEMVVTNYDIVGGRGIDELVEKVKVLLGAGWQPLGMPYATISEIDLENHYQAMVQYEASPDSPPASDDYPELP